MTKHEQAKEEKPATTPNAPKPGKGSKTEVTEEELKKVSGGAVNASVKLDGTSNT
jgi:bacteriocin-like protein